MLLLLRQPQIFQTLKLQLVSLPRFREALLHQQGIRHTSILHQHFYRRPRLLQLRAQLHLLHCRLLLQIQLANFYQLQANKFRIQVPLIDLLMQYFRLLTALLAKRKLERMLQLIYLHHQQNQYSLVQLNACQISWQ